LRLQHWNDLEQIFKSGKRRNDVVNVGSHNSWPTW
jgi:hypothetical protein